MNRKHDPNPRHSKEEGSRSGPSERRSRGALRVLLGLSAMLAASVALAAPLAVSPAADAGLATVEARCPTFSWTSVDSAAGYELVVVRADELDAPKNEQPILRVRVPPGATSWTPNLERCLASGERYAWSVRALGADGWSEPSLFRVVPAPPEPDLEEALAIVRRHLAEVAPGEPADVENTPARRSSARARPAARAASGATSRGLNADFEVDAVGNVVATSFTGTFDGNGSGLTGIPASGLSFDPATQSELDGHKGSGDHDGRYLRLSGGTVDGSGGSSTVLTIDGPGATSVPTVKVTGGGVEITDPTYASLSVDGPARWKCPFSSAHYPARLDRVGTWCVDKVVRPAERADDSMADCHDSGMSLCPLEAILTCDAANVGDPSLNSCGTVTDSAGSQIIRTFGHDGDGSGSAFSELLQYDGSDNGVQPVANSTLLPYFCCSPISPRL